MIFTEKTATATASGRKTQHRVPTGRKWRTGQRISIQPAPKKDPVCHVQLTHIEHAVPLTINRDQARLEGFDGVRGLINFKRSWLERFDRPWVARQTLTDMGLTDELVAERFDHRQDIVDILTWELCEAPDLYLAHPSRGAGDYTSNRHRAIDDLPVIDTATQARYSKDALAFCIGKQLKRAGDEAAKRDKRARSQRHAA